MSETAFAVLICHTHVRLSRDDLTLLLTALNVTGEAYDKQGEPEKAAEYRLVEFKVRTALGLPTAPEPSES